MSALLKTEEKDRAKGKGGRSLNMEMGSITPGKNTGLSCRKGQRVKTGNGKEENLDIYGVQESKWMECRILKFRKQPKSVGLKSNFPHPSMDRRDVG